MLVAHIERGQCTRIGSTDLVVLREAKLDFHRELEKRSNEPVKGSFANYMSKIHVPQWADIVEAPSAEKPGELSEGHFPGLPRKEPQASREHESKVPEKVLRKQEPQQSNKQETQATIKSIPQKWNSRLRLKPQKTDTASDKTMADTDDDESLLIDVSPGHHLAAKWQTATQDSKSDHEKGKAAPPPSTTPLAAKWQGAWGTKDIQAAIARDRGNRRVTPTTQQLAAATQPAPKALAEFMDLDDPEHTYFNASNYYCLVMSKYVCPKLGCGKYYDDKQGIIRHLKSPAHGVKSYQCPKCSRIFKSVEAITSHAESPGHCRIRETEHYGAFIDQLTGGIVQVDATGGNDGIKYNVQKKAIDKVFW
ncbi:Zinc finger, C2H2-like protein [Akanthomyces lecanii RCEF 1005]|uniref:Zinc finger, C2H2-like protein n=1 Tax=Akanthomyces lecanii RCEF 1005 TaxID=1081108 RepID=A0A168AZ12_CORDF|nr:Zinc finger, C2H2-like protein [Akanthomyces lecanii RCEF 1005]